MVILSKHGTKSLNVVDNVVDNEKNVLRLIEYNQKISAKEISEKLQMNERTAQRYLQKLQVKKLIRRIGPDNGGKWEVI